MENTAETLDDLTLRVSEHQEATFTTTVRPLDKERIPEIIVGTYQRCAEGDFTGEVKWNFNEGGLVNFTVTQKQKVPEGTTEWPFREDAEEIAP